ncbi:serine/threonine-protein phosphatase 4 regulatory subunit 1-like [Dendronephthya gigantea]|uniref:serine/threonine-protein phosphatase 4 regulatory subunit 1-like n=1 Tax=Dendronephthya gigantea TaxID=151771 RepID=UPI00106C07F0|nr:serine/threonine-protein phosphatase 4 regulatory subunit 1-like [Dendronephthya gigantea]
MADIRFLVDDYENGEEEQEEDGLEGASEDNSMLEKEIPEEFVSPLTKMDRYLNSEIIFNRRMAARCVLECLRSLKSDEDCYQVLQLMVRLSDDIEAAVRIEVMEQIPHVAVLCVEHRGLHFAIPKYILPVVVRYLTDPNNQVRKTSQAALLLLLEQEVIDRIDVEQQICPVLIELCSIDSTDDFRTEAVTMMSKMAPMLPVFMKLCQDGVWGVRKACAECFMNVSTVASKEVRRNELAPLFINLLGDKSRWVQMAAYQSLGPFISTFADPHNSGFFVDEQGKLCKFDIPVKTEGESSAEQAVGLESDEKKNAENNGMDVKTTDSGYMSPPEAHLDNELHENQALDAVSNELSELRVGQKITGREIELETFNSFNFWRVPLPQIGDEGNSVGGEIVAEKGNTANPNHNAQTPGNTTRDPATENSEQEDKESSEDVGKANDASGDSATANPGAEIEPLEDQATGSPEENPNARRLEFEDLGISDMDIDDCEELESDEKDLTCNESVNDSPKRMAPLSGIPSLRFDDDYLQPYSPNMCFDDDSNRVPSPPRSPLHNQVVIPQPLLDHYISMTEPSKAQAIDTDLAKHCAFSFPAVVLTLGAKNWSCLRETYELLSADMQWKVRRTLAFSIHELSQILGEENTRVDLVPIFNNFLKDLDEVRIGVLKHLARFIKLLAPDLRSGYLPTFSEFLTTDNARNWRFRYELAEQLIMLADVYQTSEVSDHICPIALTLGADRVAEVRQIAYKLHFLQVGILLLKLNTDSDLELRKRFTEDIMQHFASSQHWFRRLSYCQLCEVLLEADFITAEKFAIDFLPHLLTYQTDTIVNVKLALSRTLTRAVMVTDYFCRPECKDSGKVLDAIERLQADSDRDVRYFAGRHEEVPYEGRRCSDDQTYMLPTSRESFDDEMMGGSPLDGEFAEKQIEAKLLAVETTDRGDGEEEQVVSGIPLDVVSGVPLEMGSDEGFEDEGPGDEESDESSDSQEENGEESPVDSQEAGDETSVFEEEQVTQQEEESNKQEEELEDTPKSIIQTRAEIFTAGPTSEKRYTFLMMKDVDYERTLV